MKEQISKSAKRRGSPEKSGMLRHSYQAQRQTCQNGPNQVRAQVRTTTGVGFRRLEYYRFTGHHAAVRELWSCGEAFRFSLEILDALRT